MNIGFLGPIGTFSQEACEMYLSSKNINYEKLPFISISELLNSLIDDELDLAIVPIENSIEGGVTITLDTLAENNNLQIISEITLPINQNLLVNQKINFDQITQIISHPQPVGQCRKFITEFLPKATIIYDYSTASAAKKVQVSDSSVASIGSKLAVKEYGLIALRENIQDNANNFTRFVVLTNKYFQQKFSTEKEYKSSIIFSTGDTPGSLYRILDIFNIWDINMTRIESRPAKNLLGNYIFFIDILGSIENQDTIDALTMIKRKTSYYKFLGCYEKISQIYNNKPSI